MRRFTNVLKKMGAKNIRFENLNYVAVVVVVVVWMNWTIESSTTVNHDHLSLFIHQLYMVNFNPID